MWAKDPLNEVKESIFLKLDDNITKLDNGENLLKTIVGQGLKFNKEIISSEQKEVEFAKKYQMLSKNTALFGEIVKDDAGSQQTNLIKVDINEERQKAKQRNIVSARPKQYFARKAFVSNTGGIRFDTKGMPLNFAKVIKDKTLSLNPQNSFSSKEKMKVNKNYKKKASYEQKYDGTVKIVDEFYDLLMAQDIMEGYWDAVKETKNIINKIPKGGFDKIVQYIKSKNISQDFNKVIYTILAIYYIENTKSENIIEYRLVLNKGKKYLMSKGIDYNQEIKNIKI
jgi:hypothetical protein